MKPSVAYQSASAIAAFLLWGSWAYYTNIENPQIALSSGVSQGVISALLTILMVYFLAKLYTKFNMPLSRILLPSLLLSLICVIVGVTVHKLVGTLDIFGTLMPPLSAGFIFNITTCIKIHNLSQEQQ